MILSKKKSLIIALIAMGVLGIQGCGTTQNVESEVETQKELNTKTELESELQSETEIQDEIAMSEDDWNIVKDYGFDEDGYSKLSYSLHPENIQENDEYYIIPATFAKAVLIPSTLKAGEQVDITINDFDGTKLTLTCTGEGHLIDEEDTDYYYMPAEDGSDVELFCYSDDRVESDFYNGTLYIRKDAIFEIMVEPDSRQMVTSEILQDNQWFNHVKFNDKGEVTELIFCGD